MSDKPDSLQTTPKCAACGRERGTGCGRDEVVPRVGCYLLGGPLRPVNDQSQTTEPCTREEKIIWMLRDDLRTLRRAAFVFAGFSLFAGLLFGVLIGHSI